MSKILSSKTVFPEHIYDQNYFIDMISTMWPEQSKKISLFAKSVCVEERALCIEMKEILELTSLAQRNKIWMEKSVELAKRGVEQVLEDTGISITEINQFITTSVTGISIPSLDTILMNSMGFNENTQRLPLFGFGCLGGVASINRAHDYLRNNPKGVVLITAVELCSLTFQPSDLSVENLVGSSLFGDGSASVIMVGDQHRLASKGKYQVVNYGSFFYPNTEDTMGWDIRDSGFKLVLNKNVSKIVEDNIPGNVKQLLSKENLHIEDIKYSISHPGGPKVLMSMQESLGLSKEDFSNSWQSLKEHGNMSSVSVLNVLEKSIKQDVGTNEGVGIMAAMGPGFNSEITLIRKC